MDIISSFQRFLKPQYFNVIQNVSNLSLEESKGTPYKVSFRVSREINKFLVIRNLEDLKVNDANYLLENPKDCDYIILDLIKEIVYFVELKDTEKTNTYLMEQLLAGEKWFKHLMFCCQCDKNIESWGIRRIGVRYIDKRPSRRTRPHAEKGDNIYHKNVLGCDFYKLQGKEFNLDAINPAR